MEKQLSISLHSITKYYGLRAVIRNFSYTFYGGKIYLIKGENGTGKSTLLKIIARLIPFHEGEMINNLRMGYLPEQPELIRHLLSSTYLELLRKMNYRFDFSVKEALSEWEIPRRKINKCSKGNRQKIALLQLFLSHSDVFLLDEPTDSLDVESIQRLLKQIVRLQEKGKIVIIISHSCEHFKGVDYEAITLQKNDTI